MAESSPFVSLPNLDFPETKGDSGRINRVYIYIYRSMAFDQLHEKRRYQDRVQYSYQNLKELTKCCSADELVFKYCLSMF